MRAEECDRWGFMLRGERHTWGDLRKYVCDACGGAVVHRAVWNEEKDRSENLVICGKCKGREIISEFTYNRQIADSMEVRYSLPKEFLALYEGERMPLNDVLEQEQTGRLKRLGVIRLGWQEPNANSPGQHAVASDHFVMTDAPYLVQFFGEGPTSLPIYFPYPRFDDNIEAYHRVWAGGQRKGSGICICQGDGKRVVSALPFTVTRKKLEDGSERVSVRRASGDRRVSYGEAAIDFEWGDHSFKKGDAVTCPGGAHNLYLHCQACNPSIVLKISIRDEAAAQWGYYQISTRSISNYKHFLSTWNSITNGGQLSIPMNDVPFILSIAPGNTLFQDRNKAWASREAFYLQLELDPRVAQIAQRARARRFVDLLEGRSDPTRIPRLAAQAEDIKDQEDEPAPPPWFEDAEFEPVEDPPEPAQPKPQYSFKGDQVQAVIKAKLAESSQEVAAMLNLSGSLTPDDKVGRIVAWAALYRGQRDQGVEPDAAAQVADKMLNKGGEAGGA